jgi:hypothetical protein
MTCTRINPRPSTSSIKTDGIARHFLHAGLKGPWLSHVMFFVPEMPKALGSDLGDDVPSDAHEGKVAVTPQLTFR